MSENTQPPIVAETSFASLAALKAAHAELLQRRRADGETRALLDAIAVFAQRGQATGALLDDDGERGAAQSLLNYWANIAYRAGREPPDTTLAEFDPLLAPKLPDQPCPYLGLDAFREVNNDLFFGREQLVEQLLAHVKTNRLLAVVGSSGSGKSSLVRAGLIPALKAGALPDSARWRYCPPMVPGSEPLASLDRALQDAHAADGADMPEVPIVLLVDQFEELFTLCGDEQEREAFSRRLLELAQSPDLRHTVILTMRSDFEDNVAKLPALQARFQQARVQVTALSASDLRAAIEEPARKVGLKFEAGIVDELLRNILGERVGLPLLQFTLLKLWEQREGNRVTWAAYRKLGNAREALARSADAFYQGLLPEEQVTAKRILLRMVRPGAGLEITSNRIQREILYIGGEAHDRVDRVLDKLIAARLVRQSEGETSGDTQVEVAHEALVRNWPRLVDWLELERETLRRRLRLTEAAEQWQALNRDPGALLRGALLEEAQRYEDLSPLESTFVQAGQDAEAAAEREKDAARQRQLRSTRWFAAVLAVLLVCAIAAAGVAVSSQMQTQASAEQTRLQAGTAEAAKNVAETQRAEAVIARQTSEAAQKTAVAAQAEANAARDAQLLVFQAQAASDPELGLLLATKAAELAENRQTEDALRQAIQNSHVRARLPVDCGYVGAAAWSPDGQRILTIDTNSTACIWDAANGQLLLKLCCDSPVPNKSLDTAAPNGASVFWSLDGKRVLTAAGDGSARLWDAQTGQGSLTLQGPLNGGGVAWSPDERRILSSRGTSAFVWDADTGAQKFKLEGHTRLIRSVAWSRDGKRILTAGEDGAIILWDAAGGAPLDRLNQPDQIRSAVFSPDDRRILAAVENNMVLLWEPGQPAPRLLTFSTAQPQEQRGAYSVAFSPDGRFALAAGAAGLAQIWDLDATNSQPVALTGHNDLIFKAAWSADGRRVLTASRDKTVRIWEAATGKELLVLRGHDTAVHSAAFSPDGQRVLTISYGDTDTARIWSLNANEELALLRGPLSDTTTAITTTAAPVISATVGSMAFAPDPAVMAWGEAQSGTIWLRRSDSTAAQALDGHAGKILSLTFSPDGTILASSSADRGVRLWQVRDGALLNTLAITGNNRTEALNLAFSRDGTIIATGSADRFVRLWRVRDGVSLGTLPEQQAEIASMAFSPDGALLAVGQGDGKIALVDIATRSVTSTLEGHSAAVISLTFSPDGFTLLSGSDDATAMLWDVDARSPLGQPLTGHISSVTSVLWGGDPVNGRRLILTTGADGSARIWDAASREQRSVLRAGESTLLVAAWSADRRQVFTAGLDGLVRSFVVPFADLRRLAQNRVTRPLTDQELNQALSGRLSATPILRRPTPQPAAASTPEPDIFANWVEVGLLKHTTRVRGIAISPDGQLLASGSDDKFVRLWHLADRRLLHQLEGHTETVRGVAFSHDGRLLASASYDDTIRIWQVSDGTLLRTLSGHTSDAWSVAFSPDGTLLASGSNDTTVRLWNVADGRLLNTLTGHTVGVRSLAFSPDGRTLASVASDNLGSADTDIRLWQVSDGTLLSTLKGHTNGIVSVAFAPDGLTLASGSADNTVRLWRTSDGQLLHSMVDTDGVDGVAFTPDGFTLASGTDNGVIHLWRVSDGALLHTLAGGHSGTVLSVAFSRDGALLASGGLDGTVRLWAAP